MSLYDEAMMMNADDMVACVSPRSAEGIPSLPAEASNPVTATGEATVAVLPISPRGAELVQQAHETVMAMIRDALAVAKCGCGKTYSRTGFDRLHFVGWMGRRQGFEETYQLANCECGSTISRLVK